MAYSPLDQDNFYDTPRVARPPVSPIRYDPTTNARDRLRNEASRNWWDRDVADQQFRDYGVPAYEQEARYRQAGDQAYLPLLSGEGGYDEETAARIRDEENLQGLQISQEEMDRLALTPEEQSGIRGDPYSAFDFYDPSRFDETNYYTAQGQRGAAFDAAGGQRGALGSYGGNIRDLYESGDLTLDQDFADRFPMSDEEVQSISDLAGKTVANRYVGSREDLRRRSAAAGSPAFAFQAGAGRLNRESAINTADAASSARLAALAQQREQTRQLESMRLGAEQYQAGLGTQSEFGLLGSTLGTERDIADRGIGVERDVGDRLLSSERYLQDRGQDLSAYGESTSSNRLNELARNRQAVEERNQDARYGRGIDLSRESRDRETQVAEARRGDEREGRGYLRDMGQRYSDLSQSEADRRSRTTANAANTGANIGSSLVSREGQPNAFQRNVLPLIKTYGDIITAAEGAIVTKPTLALIGEAGPEAVVPLSSVKSSSGSSSGGGSSDSSRRGGVNNIQAILREAVHGARRKKKDETYMGMPHNPYEVTPLHNAA